MSDLNTNNADVSSGAQNSSTSNNSEINIYPMAGILLEEPDSEISGSDLSQRFAEQVLAEQALAGEIDRQTILEAFEGFVKNSSNNGVDAYVNEFKHVGANANAQLAIVKALQKLANQFDPNQVVEAYIRMFEFAGITAQLTILKAFTDLVNSKPANLRLGNIFTGYIVMFAHAHVNAKQAILEAFRKFVNSKSVQSDHNIVVEVYMTMFAHAHAHANVQQAIAEALQQFIDSNSTNLDLDKVVEAYGSMFPPSPNKKT
jgi:hypothetical protein